VTPASALVSAFEPMGDARGPVDGLFGPITEQAVAHFQAAHGLQVDGGIAGPQKIARLQSQARPYHRSRPRPTSPNAPHRYVRERRRPRRVDGLIPSSATRSNAEEAAGLDQLPKARVLLEARHDVTGAEAAYGRADQRGDGDLAKMARAALFDLRAGISNPGAGRVGGGHDGA
jgi:hypothetical protein